MTNRILALTFLVMMVASISTVSSQELSNVTVPGKGDSSLRKFDSPLIEIITTAKQVKPYKLAQDSLQK